MAMSVGRVIIVYSRDARQRYRFVAEPLQAYGWDVEVIQSAPARNMISLAKLLVRRKGERSVVVIIGAGVRELGVIIFARLRRIKSVVRLGGDPVTYRFVQARASLQRLRLASAILLGLKGLVAFAVLKLVRDVVVVNVTLGRQVGRYLPSGSRVSVVPQYCPGPTMRRTYQLKAPPIILTVTNLSYYSKAMGVVWLTSQLATLVAATGWELNFRIAGGGNHLAMVQRQIQQMAMPDRLHVRILGFVDDVAREYGSADIFLYHSEHDGTPNVLLEAKRWGLPVIANDYVPLRSVISEGVSGLFFADESDFQVRMKAVLTDKTLRRRLAEGGICEHEKIYTLEATGRLLSDVLQTARQQGYA